MMPIMTEVVGAGANIEPLLQVELRDSAGRPVRLAELLRQPLVVVFVRHFG